MVPSRSRAEGQKFIFLLLVNLQNFIHTNCVWYEGGRCCRTELGPNRFLFSLASEMSFTIQFFSVVDLPMLSFSLNGCDVPNASFLRIRPATDVLPAVSVQQGSTCEMIFDGQHFLFPPKSRKFKMIVCATSLI